MTDLESKLLAALREAYESATHYPSCAAMISSGKRCNCGILGRCRRWEKLILAADRTRAEGGKRRG